MQPLPLIPPLLTLLVLLSLSSLSVALPQDRNPQTKTNLLPPRYIPTLYTVPSLNISSTDPRNKTQCYDPTARGHIIFASPNRPDIELLVRTQWHILYPPRLRDALMEAGFVIVEGRTKRSCGWWEGDSVWAAGVKRGVIAWREREEEEKEAEKGNDADGDEKAQKEKAEDEDEDKEADTDPPDEELLFSIRQVLVNTYPSLEIALVVVGAAGAPFWVLLAGWMFWWSGTEVWCFLATVGRLGRRLVGCADERREEKRRW